MIYSVGSQFYVRLSFFFNSFKELKAFIPAGNTMFVLGDVIAIEEVKDEYKVRFKALLKTTAIKAKTMENNSHNYFKEDLDETDILFTLDTFLQAQRTEDFFEFSIAIATKLFQSPLPLFPHYLELIFASRFVQSQSSGKF